MTAPDPADFWRVSAPLAGTDAVTALMTGGDSEQRSAEEVAAILRLLPPIGTSDLVIEPAAGTGRFTLEFVRRAGRVHAWDLIPEFVDANRRRCARYRNATIEVADARTFDPPGGATLVFVKWLLMYVTDDEATRLIGRFLQTLAPGGSLFLHESCDDATAAAVTDRPTELWTGDFLGSTYRAYYRPAGWYRARLGQFIDRHTAGERDRAALVEFDLASLYLPGEGGGQVAWLLTLPR